MRRALVLVCLGVSAVHGLRIQIGYPSPDRLNFWGYSVHERKEGDTAVTLQITRWDGTVGCFSMSPVENEEEQEYLTQEITQLAQRESPGAVPVYGYWGSLNGGFKCVWLDDLRNADGQFLKPGMLMCGGADRELADFMRGGYESADVNPHISLLCDLKNGQHCSFSFRHRTLKERVLELMNEASTAVERKVVILFTFLYQVCLTAVDIFWELWDSWVSCVYV